MHQNFRTRLSSSPVCSTNPVKLKTCRPGRRRSWMRPRRYTCLIPEPARLGSVLKAHRVRMTRSRYPSVWAYTRIHTVFTHIQRYVPPVLQLNPPQLCGWEGAEESVLVWLLMLLPLRSDVAGNVSRKRAMPVSASSLIYLSNSWHLEDLRFVVKALFEEMCSRLYISATIATLYVASHFNTYSLKKLVATYLK